FVHCRFNDRRSVWNFSASAAFNDRTRIFLVCLSNRRGRCGFGDRAGVVASGAPLRVGIFLVYVPKLQWQGKADSGHAEPVLKWQVKHARPAVQTAGESSVFKTEG